VSGSFGHACRKASAPRIHAVGGDGGKVWLPERVGKSAPRLPLIDGIAHWDATEGTQRTLTATYDREVLEGLIDVSIDQYHG